MRLRRLVAIVLGGALTVNTVGASVGACTAGGPMAGGTVAGHQSSQSRGVMAGDAAVTHTHHHGAPAADDRAAAHAEHAPVAPDPSSHRSGDSPCPMAMMCGVTLPTLASSVVLIASAEREYADALRIPPRDSWVTQERGAPEPPPPKG